MSARRELSRVRTCVCEEYTFFQTLLCMHISPKIGRKTGNYPGCRLSFHVHNSSGQLYIGGPFRSARILRDAELRRVTERLINHSVSLCQATPSSSSTTASASISTSQSGSTKLETCMIVFTGRMSRKISPWTAATACQSSMRVSKIRVRTT